MPQNDYLVTLKLYAPNANGRIILLLDNDEQLSTGFSSSVDVQTISITVTNHEINGIRLTIDSDIGSFIYVDNLCVISQ